MRRRSAVRKCLQAFSRRALCVLGSDIPVQKAVPSIVTGLRIAAGLAAIGTITGEFLAAEGGERAPLGILIMTAMRNFATDRVFVAVVLAAGVGFLLFGVVSAASRLLLAKWMR